MKFHPSSFILHTLKGLLPPSGGPARFPALDGLRGLACLAVVLYHTPLIGAFRSIPGSYGRPAVSIFFVLSAFLLYYPWAIPAPQLDFHKYYKRRFFRIMPLWLLMLLAAVLSISLIGGKVSAGNIASHVFFAHTFFSQWSAALIFPAYTLATEIQFYLLLPLIVWMIRKRPLVSLIALGALTGLLQFTMPTSVTANWTSPLRNNFPYPAFPFIVGMLVAWMVRNGVKLPAFLPYVGLGCALIFPPISLLLKSGITAFIFNGPVHFWYALFSASIIYGLCQVSKFSQVVAWRPLRFAGLCGYGIFLNHAVILILLKHFTSPLVSAICLLPLSVLTAYPLYLFIESPFIQFSRRPSPPLVPSSKPESLPAWELSSPCN